MFANIKKNYESIERQLGTVIRIHPGMPLLLDLVDKTIGRANSKAKLNRSLLLFAASKGDIVKINSMLADGMDVNARKNVTAHFAESLGNVFLYREIAYEPSSNLRPLHFAALNGHCEVVELLISKGADINAKDDSGLTPLHLASGGGSEEIVKLLSNSGADVNAKDSNDVVPLHFAAEGGYLNIVQFLISEGARVNAKTKSFNFKEKTGENSFFQHNVGIWTSLHFAIKNKHLDVTKVLLSMEVSIKGDYINPLNLADKESFMEAVKLLMSMDKNVIRLGVGNYQKLFELGIEKNSPEVIKALVRKEINVNIEYQDGTTPLCRAVRCYDVSDSPNYELSLEVIRILLENGADTNFVDRNGCTSLDYTVMARNDAADILSWDGEYRMVGFIDPVIRNRKYADILIGLLLENSCSKDTLLKCISLVKGDDPVMFGSLKLIVRHFLANHPGEEKPEYLRRSRRGNVADLSNYWDKCIAEMVKMKEKSFGHGLLLYDVFIEKDSNKVALYTKNKNIMEYCEYDACKDAYPIYKDLIIKKLSNYKERAELLDKLNKITIHKGDATLNSDCQLNIVKYLPDNDLYNLVRAAVCETFVQPSTELNDINVSQGASAGIGRGSEAGV